jgi:hypothetical protein
MVHVIKTPQITKLLYSFPKKKPRQSQARIGEETVGVELVGD